MQEFLKTDNLSRSFFLPPALYVVATPIGNFSDITLRAIEILQKCDAVICEDSRISANLLSKLQIKKSLMIYNDHSDEEMRQKILHLISSGKSLALVSDAGTPLISDPGYKLVTMLLENDIKVVSIPGACSVVAALSISGIESNRFLFAGFIPSAKSERESFLKELSIISSTLIFFETSHRIAESLEVMLKIFGNRTAAVVREITKIYEETKKDYLENLVEFYQSNKIKGEIVILISPPSKKPQEVDFDLIDKELELSLKTMKPKDAVAVVADNYNLNKKELYQRMLKIISERK